MAVGSRGIEEYLGLLIQTVLNEMLMTNLQTSDDSRPDYVLLGKPTDQRSEDKVVSIWIHHPLGLAKDLDENVEGRRSTGDNNWFPAEMGELRYAMERLVGGIQINIREDLEYPEALRVISSLKRRIVYVLDTDTRLKDTLTDDFGFSMIKFETFQAAGVVSGGQRTTIHNEWISWRCYIGKPQCAV